MAWGGGTFLTQNKILGGAYINFISKVVPFATLRDRGVVAFGFELDWGVDDKIFEVVESDVLKNSLEIFGYDYASDKIAGIKDIFKTQPNFMRLNLTLVAKKQLILMPRQNTLVFAVMI